MSSPLSCLWRLPQAPPQALRDCRACLSLVQRFPLAPNPKTPRALLPRIANCAAVRTLNRDRRWQPFQKLYLPPIPCFSRCRIAGTWPCRSGIATAAAGEYPYVRTSHWWDPFNRNRLKGDKPIFGQQTFLNITATSDTSLEERRVPADEQRQLGPARAAAIFSARASNLRSARRSAFPLTCFTGTHRSAQPTGEFRLRPR